MRVVSWNVRSLRDGSREVAQTLRALAPDVVVLQEAPRLVLWRLSRRRLARRSGLRLVTARKAAGNLLLARDPAELSWSRSFHKPNGLHRRGTVGAIVNLQGRRLAVLGTHLDLEPASRRRTAAAVRRQAPNLPLVVCADVNELPGEDAWSLLVEGLVDTGSEPTFPAHAPVRRIDVLAASPTLRVELQVLPTTASDHRVLVADVAWLD